jgi:hypothetical protein
LGAGMRMGRPGRAENRAILKLHEFYFEFAYNLF